MTNGAFSDGVGVEDDGVVGAALPDVGVTIPECTGRGLFGDDCFGRVMKKIPELTRSTEISPVRTSAHTFISKIT